MTGAVGMRFLRSMHGYHRDGHHRPDLEKHIREHHRKYHIKYKIYQLQKLCLCPELIDMSFSLQAHTLALEPIIYDMIDI